MFWLRTVLPPACLALAACGATPEAPPARAFDLIVLHPSPQSTYLQVTPGAGGGPLPPPQQMLTGNFARYLRATTGCTLDTTTPVAVMGNRTVPAGYLVPVICP